MKIYYYICSSKALKEWHSGILVLTAAFGALFVYVIYGIQEILCYNMSVIPDLDLFCHIQPDTPSMQSCLVVVEMRDVVIALMCEFCVVNERTALKEIS